MEQNIICPHCNKNINDYKCEYTCNYCNTIYCLSCKKEFHIINNITNKDHYNKCYINSKL